MDFVVGTKQDYFKRASAKQASSLGVQIITLAKFWCLQQKYNTIEKLTTVLPSDVKGLLDDLLTIPTRQAGYNPSAWDRKFSG